MDPLSRLGETNEDAKRLEPTTGRVWPFEELHEPGVFCSMAMASLIANAGRLFVVAISLLGHPHHDPGALDARSLGSLYNHRHRGRFVPPACVAQDTPTGGSLVLPGGLVPFVDAISFYHRGPAYAHLHGSGAWVVLQLLQSSVHPGAGDNNAAYTRQIA